VNDKEEAHIMPGIFMINVAEHFAVGRFFRVLKNGRSYREKRPTFSDISD
jgi:hypothetical protein